MKTILLSPEEVANNWNEISTNLKPAMDHGQGETPLIEYLSRVLAGYAQVWLFFDNENKLKGYGLTQFREYTNYRTLQLVATAGVDWLKWAEGYYTVEEFARISKCKRVEMWGREGWLRRLPKVIPGWKQAYVVMSKDIETKESSNEIKN